MKPKLNLKIPAMDNCQTPGYALGPLIPYLKPWWRAWEPACGEGLLVEALIPHVDYVMGTDIQFGTDGFLTPGTPAGGFDAIITNPPYSKKYDFIAKAYEYGKPWALLMPVETIAAKKAQLLFAKHGMEVILLDARVDFKMPNKGFNGSSAQFPVAWFTWKFEIGQEITYMAHIEKVKHAEPAVAG